MKKENSVLARKVNSHNPFFFGDKEIYHISLYSQKEQNVLFSVRWFGGAFNQHNTLEVPKIISRTKVKLDGKTFIIKERIDYLREEKFVIYIPYEHFEFTGKKIEEDSGLRTHTYIEYQSFTLETVHKELQSTRWNEKYDEALVLKNQIIQKLSALRKLDKHYQVLSFNSKLFIDGEA